MKPIYCRYLYCIMLVIKKVITKYILKINPFEAQVHLVGLPSPSPDSTYRPSLLFQARLLEHAREPQDLLRDTYGQSGRTQITIIRLILS